MSDDALRLVLTNCPPDTAEALARALVQERVAACVNLIPGVRSVYWWQGEVCDEPEVTLLIKTTASRADALRERLIALHPYTVAEVVTLSPEQVSAAYGAWAAQAVSASDDVDG